MKMYCYASDNGYKEAVVFMQDDAEEGPEDFLTPGDGLKYIETVTGLPDSFAVSLQSVYHKENLE